MTLTDEERDRRIRETLERLRAGGRKMALAIAGDLIDIGMSADTAWELVASTIGKIGAAPPPMETQDGTDPAGQSPRGFARGDSPASPPTPDR